MLNNTRQFSVHKQPKAIEGRSMASSEDKGVISYTDVFAKDKTAKSRRKRRQGARVHVTCHFAV
jgi:hypothetical protein